MIIRLFAWNLVADKQQGVQNLKKILLVKSLFFCLKKACLCSLPAWVVPVPSQCSICSPFLLFPLCLSLAGLMRHRRRPALPVARARFSSFSAQLDQTNRVQRLKKVTITFLRGRYFCAASMRLFVIRSRDEYWIGNQLQQQKLREKLDREEMKRASRSFRRSIDKTGEWTKIYDDLLYSR